MRKKKSKKGDLTLTDDQIIQECVNTYRTKGKDDQVIGIIFDAMEYALARDYLSVPKVNSKVLTPIGILTINKEFIEGKGDDVIAEYCGDSYMDFLEGIAEWFYILGFYLNLEKMGKDKAVDVPYSPAEFTDMLDNTVAMIHYFMDIYARREDAKDSG